MIIRNCLEGTQFIQLRMIANDPKKNPRPDKGSIWYALTAVESLIRYKIKIRNKTTTNTK